MVLRKYQAVLVGAPVEALQVTPETVARAVLWCGGVEVEEIDPLDNKKKYVGINVPSEHGYSRAGENYWIIKHSDGSFGTMGPEEFSHTFRLLEEGE